MPKEDQGPGDIWKQLAEDPTIGRLFDDFDHPKNSENCPEQQEIRMTTLESMVGLLGESMELCGLDSKFKMQALDPILERINGAGIIRPEQFMQSMEWSLFGVEFNKDWPKWTDIDSFINTPRERLVIHDLYDFSKEYTEFTTKLSLYRPEKEGQKSFSEYIQSFAQLQQMTEEREQLFRGYIAGRLMEELYVFGMSDVHQSVREIEMVKNHPHELPQLQGIEDMSEAFFTASRNQLNTFDYSPATAGQLYNVRIGDQGNYNMLDFVSIRMHTFPPERQRLQIRMGTYIGAMQAIHDRIIPRAA